MVWVMRFGIRLSSLWSLGERTSTCRRHVLGVGFGLRALAFTFSRLKRRCMMIRFLDPWGVRRNLQVCRVGKNALQLGPRSRSFRVQGPEFRALCLFEGQGLQGQ